MHLSPYELEDDLLPDFQTLQEFDEVEPLYPSASRGRDASMREDFDISPEMNAYWMENASRRFVVR